MIRKLTFIAVLSLALVVRSSAAINSVTGMPEGTAWEQFSSEIHKNATKKAAFLTGLGLATPGTGVATFLGTPTSANLAAAITNETGTGLAVFNTSPTFVTPLLGTPTSGVLTNCTGTAAGLTAGNVTTNANLTGHVTSTGNAAVLGSFTLAQLNTATSDANLARTDAANTFTGVQTMTSAALISPVVTTGLTASGSASNDFSASTGTFKTSSGLSTVSGGLQHSTAGLSGAGAVLLTTTVTKLTSTGVAEALTLADGVDGQVKIIVHEVDGGSSVLTPTTKTGFTTITFTNVGESATLVFVTTRGWIIVALNGAVAG